MMKYADIIIPKGAENGVAIDIICQNLKLKLKKLGLIRTKSILNLEKEKEKENVIDFDIIEKHISIPEHCKQLKTPDLSCHDELKVILSKLVKNQDLDLKMTYMNVQIQRLVDLLGSIKGHAVYYGYHLSEEQCSELRSRIESGQSSIVFYPSMVQTEKYSKLIQLIMRTSEQKGKLKVCSLFADENCSRDLGRYDMLEMFFVYFSNYLKMFQLSFDEEMGASFECMFEKQIKIKLSN